MRVEVLLKGEGLTDRKNRFDASVTPHLSAAYNLARWLLKNDVDAQDVVQESFLRAFRFFDGLKGDDARPWLLGIVRNTAFTWLREQGKYADHVEFDDDRDSDASDPAFVAGSNNPEQLLLRKIDAQRLNNAIENLPAIYREVIVLREMEDMSYEQIAAIVAIPPGTVMSRLSRARVLLRKVLTETDKEPTS